jgi:oligopeptide/dipeptide ABC transporter ATP-binding protein
LPLLEIKNLQVTFDTEAGPLRAVDGVSLAVEPGQTLGVVGESGCGKSVTSLAVLRLVPSPPGRITGGQILFKGRDLLAVPARELPAVRGREIGMIFQNPVTSLNPVFTIERQMGEVLRLRFGLDRRAARERTIEALRTVGIPDPASRLMSYPHELSGGMKQRVMIAMALLGEPDLLIADEPTTALDVTIQAQILYLIKELQKKTGAAVILITHDMGVVAETCDTVAVMYAGRVVERGAVAQIFERSHHPYTWGLLRSIPKKGQRKDTPLLTIEGTVPSLLSPPKGCRFADRCPHRKSLGEAEQKKCFEVDPPLAPVEGDGANGTLAACHWPLNAECGMRNAE